MFTDYSNNLDANFIYHIESLDGYNEFNFYNIINAFGRVFSNNVEFYDCWIYEIEDRWCVGFWITGNYLFNSNNLIHSDTKIIKNKIDFGQFGNGFHFTGNTQIIEQLSNSNLDYSLEPFKERYYYSLNSLKLKTKFSKEVDLSKQEDIKELSILYQKYFHEEYDGKNDKDLQTTTAMVESLHSRKLIYRLKLKGKIVGFCTIMNFLHPELNMIGTIFIDKKFRAKGNGIHLLSFVTEKIHKERIKVFLMTTKENISSNKMVEKIGFKKQYNHSDRIIKNYG
ncbi:GNAT family N-acetyltransferase [Salegentibacter maritimus]|uniref:GNAT family N-acetyltransferase n=1 Tax=Salegentibacter maritimus TaxID=2794347 RepID=UPI0018E46593|nr:GNAT family N-acetyltransferase [Salegentibacter maritimus]MBI6117886.1 GNAT family N-acetyltransferase [Salegentibacter maritimus]